MIQLFLSHSKAIKSEIVIPFLNDLLLLDFPYWFDRSTIRCGDDIYESIIDGINNTSHCIAFIDKTYLNKGWPLKELELFHEKEIKVNSKIIIPIYCGIEKELVYETVPWLKNRAFEKTEKCIYQFGEKEKIVCRIISILLSRIDATPDISVVSKLLSYGNSLPLYEILHILYFSRYYLSSDLKLSCIELCNILSVLSLICDALNVHKDSFQNSISKIPLYIKTFVLSNPEYICYDFIVTLEKCINHFAKNILQALNS